MHEIKNGLFKPHAPFIIMLIPAYIFKYNVSHLQEIKTISFFFTYFIQKYIKMKALMVNRFYSAQYSTDSQ